MAELVRQARGRGGNREREETAIPVRGALVRAPRGPGEPFAPNANRQTPASRSNVLTDQEVIDFLESSGRVNQKELFSYITPADLVTQDPKIDPITQAINFIINCMARTRRLLLYKDLTKTSNPADVSRMETQLARWPGQVRIEEIDGRSLRIHPFLVTDITLLD